MKQMCLVNGKPCNTVSVNDRALAYGDGLFETISVINNQLHNWDLHYLRLCTGAKRLAINHPDEKKLIHDISNLLQTNSTERVIIKLILSRGEGGRGYQCSEFQSNNTIIMMLDWPEYPAQYYLQGIDVKLLDFQLSLQPALAGIKHLNRLEQIMAKQALPQDYQEALLGNTSGKLIEGISSNVYFVKSGILCIPSLTDSGIAGTMRAQIIKLCQELKIEHKIADFKMISINEADEMFYSNSIIGLWPVKKLSLLNNDKKYFHPGKIYLKLAAIINRQLGHPTGSAN